ncbi:MAG: hypothetical protein AVO35_13185 [Candidatus Aegiribacteria sp. MLS_C]|nr:MAG: hypothetical protein AVO35_13185 [Candidatus Aegiribacteria sp. MLS_C]
MVEVTLETAPRILQTVWLVTRIAAVWFAFHGMGVLARARLLRGRHLEGLPSLVLGIMGLVVLTLVLSLMQLLTRWFLPFVIMSAAAYGVLDLHRRRRYASVSGQLRSWLAVPAGLTLAVLLLSDIFHAAIPHGMVDPLITYAVQPDRWLDAGGMYFLSETKFSLFPLIGEMLAVWPASLSEGMVDQLIILQLFQFSLLTGSFLIAVRFMGLGWKGAATVLLLCLSSPILVKWGSWAKNDMTALFMSTVSLSFFFRFWYSERNTGIPLIAWFLMGLAISVKLTAAFAMTAAIPAVFICSGTGKWKQLLMGLGAMALVPMVFAIRNLMITGEPFYPWNFPFFSPNESWNIESIQVLDSIKERGSASLLDNLVLLIRSWGGIGIIFLAGVLAAVRIGWRRVLPPFITVVIYAVVSCLVFDPISWGEKYAIILLPCMAAVGTFYLRKWTRVVLLIVTVLVIMTSSFSDRAVFIWNFFRDRNPLQFQGLDTPPAMPLHLWANENLPQGSRLLSMWRYERYFSDHVILVLQNHPDGVELLLENSLAEEFEILDRMGVDYLYFHAEDPMPGDLESRIRLFSAIGDEGRIRPVVEVSGYLLCRIVDPDSEDRVHRDVDPEYDPVGRESLSCPSD